MIKHTQNEQKRVKKAQFVNALFRYSEGSQDVFYDFS